MENGPIVPLDIPRTRILIVDDHPNTANMLARAITRINPQLEVVSASSGEDALEQEHHVAFDIVITDLKMPGMSGLELISRLERRSNGEAPISYLITAYDTPEAREKAHDVNVRDVFIKPVNPELICQHVSSTLNELNGSEVIPQGSNMQQVDINALVWDVTNEFQGLAKEKNQILAVRETAERSYMAGNKDLLKQAILILTKTALENTPEGGAIVLDVHQENNFVFIKVQESGLQNPTSQTAEDGSEYMLQVRSIAEQHGGEFSVKNATSDGSMFSLSLPIQTPITDTTPQTTNADEDTALGVENQNYIINSNQENSNIHVEGRLQ